MNKENKEFQHNLWHQDPTNWKLGIFYYNKADDRMLLPKRTKLMGWTLNFARWQTWIIMAMLIITIVLLNQKS
jgi:uncharacterized membrane protein